MSTWIWAFLGTGFTFLMTTLGAAVVFLFRGEINPQIQKVLLGFAAGVMVAASVWSLLLPAIEAASKEGTAGWIPAAGGVMIGAAGLFWMDAWMTRKKIGGQTELLIVAVTLHNIPEGMAVGLAFALAAQQDSRPALYAAAFALAVGIGIQNLPEGAAVALPLRQAGWSAPKAFLTGTLSGMVEPVFGVGVTLAAKKIESYMPWLLSFAAGAMLYVVIEELIPEANRGESKVGTAGVMAGFLIMMVLDVALG